MLVCRYISVDAVGSFSMRATLASATQLWIGQEVQRTVLAVGQEQVTSCVCPVCFLCHLCPVSYVHPGSRHPVCPASPVRRRRSAFALCSVCPCALCARVLPCVSMPCVTLFPFPPHTPPHHRPPTWPPPAPFAHRPHHLRSNRQLDPHPPTCSPSPPPPL